MGKCSGMLEARTIGKVPCGAESGVAITGLWGIFEGVGGWEGQAFWNKERGPW
jgi:hypothetical protein